MNQIRIFTMLSKPSHLNGILCSSHRMIATSSFQNSKLGTAPTPNKTLSSHHHWTIERIVAIGMLPLYPTAWIFDNHVMSAIVVTAVSLHAFWGLDGVLKDYVMERRYGPLLQPIARNLWKVISAIGFAGLMYFEFNDIGFVKGVKQLWSL